jgi:carbonic anhydrase
MAMLDECLRSNQPYAAGFKKGHLHHAPARKLAVVACMDARLMVDQFLGLKIGDAHVIRNAGGLVTDDALRSLVISYHLLGTREFFVIEHTGCGMLGFEEEPVKQQIAQATSSDTSALRLHPFKNLEENLRAQVGKIKASPWIPRDVAVHGLIYQVEDGRLRLVV